jgi:transcription antitermination factor NusG
MLSFNPTLWFVLQVVPKMEIHVAAALRGKGYEEFLPMYKQRRRWSDRVKVVDLPLFPGYVFCRFIRDSDALVVTTPGVRRILGFGARPQAVGDDEMESLRKVVGSRMDILPCPFHMGQKVRIEDGPLMGVVGTLIRTKNRQRFVVSIEILMRSVAVDVEAHNLSTRVV